MAKKIRFPLKMEDEIEVRTLSELYDNFSLTKILDYVSNGKLITWLRDRHENEIADSIEKLDINSDHLPEQICEIFNISNVAFCQDDLYDLLDKQHNTIYLYGNKFEIPLNKNNITYIGFNNPVVIINANKEINWEEKKITLSKVQFDDKYKRLLEQRNTYTYFSTSNLTKENTKKLIRTNLSSTPNLLDPCLKTKQGKLIASNLILDHLDDNVPKELLEPLVDLIKGAKTEEELIEKMTVYIAGAAQDDPMQKALSELLVLFDVDNARTINGISMADINKDIDNDIFAGFIMLVMFHALLQDDSMAELLSFVGVDGSVKTKTKRVNIKSGKAKNIELRKQSKQSNPKSQSTEEEKKGLGRITSMFGPTITANNSNIRNKNTTKSKPTTTPSNITSLFTNISHKPNKQNQSKSTTNHSIMDIIAPLTDNNIKQLKNKSTVNVKSSNHGTSLSPKIPSDNCGVFHLEKFPVINTTNMMHVYTGTLNSVVWRIFLRDDDTINNAEVYINTLTNNIDSITKDFNDGPKISIRANNKTDKLTVTTRTPSDIVDTIMFSENPSKNITLELSNGFVTELYNNGLFKVKDNRNSYLKLLNN